MVMVVLVVVMVMMINDDGDGDDGYGGINTPQTHLQVSLMVAFPQLRVSLPRYV